MSQSKQSGGRTAGAFDIRVIISALIGLYGIALVLLGLFHNTAQEMARADGLNINLWGGLAMIVVAVIFGAWARLKPVVVPEEFIEEEEGGGRH